MTDKARTRISLKLDPTSAVAGDDDNPIVVTATVTGPSQLQQIDVNFSVDSGPAIFSEGDNFATESTDDQGVATANLDSAEASQGVVSAWLSDDDTVKACATYKFTSTAKAAFTPIKVDDKNAFADGKTVVTVTSNYEENGIGVPNVAVTCKLVECKAVFPGHQPLQELTVPSGAKGLVQVQFVDQSAETGVVTMETGNQGAIAEADFTVREVPAFKFEHKANAVPADGTSENEITVSLTDSAKKPYADVHLTFELPTTASFVAGGAERDSGADPHHCAGTTGPDGQYTVGFTSTTTGTGKLSVWTTVNQEHQGDEPFEFTSDWMDIANLNFGSTSAAAPGRIFANGLHQAKLVISFELTDKAGNPVSASNSPSIDEVMASVDLVEYGTNRLINQAGVTPVEGSIPDWAWSRTANEWQKTSLMQLDRDGGPDNWIDNGYAFLTYYLTAAALPKTAQLQIGMVAYPRGRNGPAVYNSATGSTWHQPAYVEALAPAVYTEDALTVDASLIIHEGMNDDGPMITEGFEDAGNYWRQWNYSVRLSAPGQAQLAPPVIHRCLRISDIPLAPDFSFSSRSESLYNYKAYLWPNNVSDANGTPLPGGGPEQTVQSTGTASHSIAVPDEPATLYFTLYAAFGNLSVKSHVFSAVRLVIYDQYGNASNFYLDAISIPYRHSSTDILKWQFLRAGPPILMPSERVGYTDPVRLLNGPRREARVTGIANKGGLDNPPLVLDNDMIKVMLSPRSGREMAAEIIGPETVFDIQIGSQSYNGKLLYITTDRTAPVMVLDTASDAPGEWHLSPIWNKDACCIGTWVGGRYVFWYNGTIKVPGFTGAAVFASDYREILNLTYDWDFVI